MLVLQARVRSLRPIPEDPRGAVALDLDGAEVLEERCAGGGPPVDKADALEPGRVYVFVALCEASWLGGQ